MPSLASAPPAPTGQNGKATSAPQAMVPFIRASSEHREPIFDVTSALAASGSRDMGAFDIPAYGFVRSILLEVTGSGATGTPNFAENYPFSVLRDISFQEPNGSPIASFNSGFDLYLANKYGGYRDPIGSDPKSSPVYYSGNATGDFRFILRVPIELNQRDALGALPNQNSGATFKLRFGLSSGAANGGLFGSTAPTAQPNIRVRAYLEAWDQPAGGQGGQVNATNPPALNTTQFWSTQVFNVNAGNQTIRLTRVGQYLRNLVMYFQRAGTSRALGDGDFMDPTTIMLDTRPLDAMTVPMWRHTMWERSGFGGRAAGGVLTAPVANDAAGAQDNGVFVYDFTHEFDGTYGMENRDLWLPSMSSTRLELQGSFANAGTLTVLTNDVAISGPVFM